ncbi:hypothetical protein KKA87_17125 [bacterium]|nr:hypothetical protein [bacterium]MBU1874380.1 hypothetical protein [bacterium]
MDSSISKYSKILFNPFTVFSRNQTLIIGLIIIFIAGFINSFTNTHFDGIFDIHTGKSSAFVVFITEGYINLILLTGLLFLIGKLFTKQDANIIDLLSQQAIARWPLLLSSIITISKPYQRFSRMRSLRELHDFGIFKFNSFDDIVVSLSIIVLLIITIWTVALMYKSFHQTYKVERIKSVLLFTLGILLAEILSKLFIQQII